MVKSTYNDFVKCVALTPLPLKNVIKLQGVIKDYDIDFSDLKKFKEDSWRHVEKGSMNG